MCVSCCHVQLRKLCWISVVQNDGIGTTVAKSPKCVFAKELERGWRGKHHVNLNAFEFPNSKFPNYRMVFLEANWKCKRKQKLGCDAMIELLFLISHCYNAKYLSMHQILTGTWLRRNSIDPVNTSFTGAQVRVCGGFFFLLHRSPFSIFHTWQYKLATPAISPELLWKECFVSKSGAVLSFAEGSRRSSYHRGTKKQNLACMAGCTSKKRLGEAKCTSVHVMQPASTLGEELMVRWAVVHSKTTIMQKLILLWRWYFLVQNEILNRNRDEGIARTRRCERTFPAYKTLFTVRCFGRCFVVHNQESSLEASFHSISSSPSSIRSTAS